MPKVGVGMPPVPLIEGGVVDGRFGHIKVPCFRDSGDEETAIRFIDTGHRVIREIDESGVCGWIVDVRENTGGTMWPMLAAIGPVLGAGIVGGVVDATANENIDWCYRDGAAGICRHDGSTTVKARGSGNRRLCMGHGRR